MKKAFWLIIIFVAIIVAYLFLAHFSIYYRMGKAGLKFPDLEKAYVVGNNSSQTKNLVYVALGDSLTSGVGVNDYKDSYPYILAEKMASSSGQEIALKDFSYPGYRASDLITNFLPQAIAAKPDVVTLLIGVNDIHGWVSENVFRTEYQYILEELTKKTKAKIYIISVPFLGSDTLLLPPYNFYFKQETVRYNRIIAELAANYNLKFVDIYSPTVGLFEKNGPYYAPDLFHPSAEGYNLWAKIIYDNINN